MKIAIVIERIETWRGGAETSTMEIARLLGESGHDVHVVTATNAQSPPGMTIHHVPPGATLRPLRLAAFVRRSAAFVREGGFDVVHSVVPLPTADVYQPRGGLLAETAERNVATRPSRPKQLFKRALAAMNFKQRSMLALERETFRPSGPRIAAVSGYVQRQCERLYGAMPPRVRVVFNGVDIDPGPAEERVDARAALRKQYHIADRTLVVLFLAHNFRLKGLGALIAAIGKVVSGGFSDVRLLVVGRDNPVRYLREVQSRGLDRHVIFAGPTRRALSFYHAADVCVHPTYYDPCSRVVLEALSVGLPCITTAYNGAAEVMEDGREGFVIARPDDVDALADRIVRMGEPALRQAMSGRASALRERISMRRHVAELESLLRETAASGSRACRIA